jgi:hypothetical protein
LSNVIAWFRYQDNPPVIALDASGHLSTDFTALEGVTAAALVGSPQGIAPPRLPQIRTCGVGGSGYSAHGFAKWRSGGETKPRRACEISRGSGLRTEQDMRMENQSRIYPAALSSSSRLGRRLAPEPTSRDWRESDSPDPPWPQTPPEKGLLKTLIVRGF